MSAGCLAPRTRVLAVVALLTALSAGCDTFSLDSLTVNNDLTVGGTIHASAITGNSPLDIQMGGASRIYVDDATGNVGIGTTTPAMTLDVAGDLHAAGTVFADAVSSNSPLALQTAGTTRIYVDDVLGNVGIGTTNPEYRLHVTGGSAHVQSAVYAASFEAKEGFPLVLRTGGETRLRIQDDSLGYVGIRTESPGSQLDVRGAIRSSTFPSTGVVNSVEIQASGDVGDISYWHRVGNTTTGGQKLRFTLTTTRMNGLVGIGRNPTTHGLEVTGNASKSVAGDWVMNCDARLKTDIESVGSALDTLDKVRLVGFRYNDDYRAANPEVPDQRYLGVIAQEFRQVFPDYVYESNDKLPDGERILQVDTYPLTIYSAAAVQELHRRDQEQRAEIDGLREQLADLAARLEAMERRSPSNP